MMRRFPPAQFLSVEHRSDTDIRINAYGQTFRLHEIHLDRDGRGKYYEANPYGRVWEHSPIEGHTLTLRLFPVLPEPTPQPKRTWTTRMGLRRPAA
jgi:hypothetical protein